MSRPLFLPFLAASAAFAAADNWDTYHGDKSGSQYSTLRQITPANVAQLEVAWTYRAGGLDGKDRTQIQCNPLVIDGVLYGTTPDLQLFALDAGTGTCSTRTATGCMRLMPAPAGASPVSGGTARLI